MFQVLGIDQSLQRHANNVGITEVLIPVRIRQPLRVNEGGDFAELICRIGRQVIVKARDHDHRCSR